MTLLLAIDTATPAGSVALSASGSILALRNFESPREHSRRLFPEIDRALVDAGAERGQIGAVAVTIGPGSYTGLRIGLSAAKGLCMALDACLVGLSTLEVMAARVPWCRLPVCAVLEARRDDVYAAAFDTSEGLPRLMAPERVVARAELVAEWSDRGVLFTGDGLDRLRDLPELARLAPAPVRRPCAAEAAWLAGPRLARGEILDPGLAEPVYLGRPAFVTPRYEAAASATTRKAIQTPGPGSG